MGADIPDTTPADWCGAAMRTLAPRIERIEADVMASDILQADDTPIRVLDRSAKSKGLGKGVKQGRIWTYVRDQRPWAGQAPPGAVHYVSPDRKGGHPRTHLENSAGILQADACTGFKALQETRSDGSARFREAACWAHRGRDFHDIWTATRSGLAREARDHIAQCHDIEREIKGLPAGDRYAVRQRETKPKVDAFHTWAKAQLARIPGQSDLAKAFRHGLSRWPSFTPFLEDGRVAIDNNAAERGMRPIGAGRRNGLFAGSDTGGETLARAMTIIETAKMNGLDPQAYLPDVLDRIHDHKINPLDELPPWNRAPIEPEKCKTAQTGRVPSFVKLTQTNTAKSVSQTLESCVVPRWTFGLCARATVWQELNIDLLRLMITSLNRYSN